MMILTGREDLLSIRAVLSLLGPAWRHADISNIRNVKMSRKKDDKNKKKKT